MSNEGLATVLAEFFRRNEGALLSVRAEHEDDGKGRCRVCRNGPNSTGKTRWPCTIASLTLLAPTPLRVVRQPE